MQKISIGFPKIRSLTNIENRSHTLLTDIGVNTHAQIDTHLAGTLAAHAATTSAQLAGVISDETGSGVLVFGTSPTFTTSLTCPLIIGGTGTTSDLYLQTTSGVGATGADMHFLVGNNGATEAMTILNSGNVGIGTTGPNRILDISQNVNGLAEIGLLNANAGASAQSGMKIGSNLTSNAAYLWLNYNNSGVSASIGTAADVTGGLTLQTNATSAPLVFSAGSSGYLAFQLAGSDKVRIDNNGNVGIGTTSPTISGTGKFHMTADTFRLDTARTITNATDAGNLGEWCADSNYIYIATGTNQWKRAALSSW